MKSVHKYQNRSETFQALVKKIQSYGILVCGLFMFGFDGDEGSVFEETAKSNIAAGYDVCAYSVLTPYPGPLACYELLGQKRMISYDWEKYDQGRIVYQPMNLTPEQLREGHTRVYKLFYSIPSILRRFPTNSSRNKFYWSSYNLFFRKGELQGAVLMMLSPNPLRCHDIWPSRPSCPQGKTGRNWRTRITVIDFSLPAPPATPN